MWRLIYFASGFHARREGDGDVGGMAERASFGRGRAGCFPWEGAAEDCFVAGNGIGTADDPQPGTQACHSTGVTEKWQKMPGDLGVVPLQESQVLVPLAIWVPEPGSVGSEEGVLLPLLAHTGDGAAKGCGSHLSCILGWVLHARGQAWISLIDVKTWVRNAPGPEYLAVLLHLELERAHLIAVPLPVSDGSYWSSREGVRGVETGWQRTPPALHRDVSQAVFIGCAD